MERQIYELNLTLQAPLLTRASGSMSFGLDMAMLKEGETPVLLGSLVRGNLREALGYFQEVLADDDLQAALVRWFGDEGDNDERGALTFDYYWRPLGFKVEDQRRLRHRIGIDAVTGTVESGNLQVIEERFALGELPVFQGRITARLRDDRDRNELEKWLKKALAYVPALGALKSVGFGKLLGAELRHVEATKTTLRTADAKAKRLGLMLHLDRPFCVARPHRPDDNRFVGEDVIPGNVIKGAFARTCGLSSAELDTHLDFDRLLFTHAQPARKDAPTRGMPLPLSIALFGGGRVRDLAGQTEACLLKRDGKLWAPLFAIDWKDADKAQAYAKADCLPATPRRMLAVRTAIHAASGTSDEGKLFSQECVIDQNDDEEELVWCFDVDLSAIESESRREKVLVELMTRLGEGIEGIGKTKARATVSLAKQPFLVDAPLSLDKQVIVTLRSPARLLKAERKPADWHAPDALTAEYRDYWHKASGGASGAALELSHHFSQLSLYGGGFYFRHYRQQRNDKRYLPEWLTAAGSVFVLTVKDAKTAAEHLAEWRRRGLPPAQDRAGEGWQTDPFIGMNGFGEIAIDHPLHQRLGALEEGESYEAAK